MKWAIAFLTLLSTCLCAQDKNPRVFVVDHDSYEAHQVTGESGIRRMNTEQVKNLNKACPALTIRGTADGADYIIVWDTKTWQQTSWTGHQNEFAVYKASGDLVKTGDAHLVSGAAKDICNIIQAAQLKASKSPTAQPKNAN